MRPTAVQVLLGLAAASTVTAMLAVPQHVVVPAETAEPALVLPTVKPHVIVRATPRVRLRPPARPSRQPVLRAPVLAGPQGPPARPDPAPPVEPVARRPAPPPPPPPAEPPAPVFVEPAALDIDDDGKKPKRKKKPKKPDDDSRDDDGDDEGEDGEERDD